MNLTELQKEAHAIAKEKGWWDEEPTFGDCIALVHSKLSKVRKAYRQWRLASSLEILRHTIPPPSCRDEDETEVECWFIHNEDTGEFDYWELMEYAAGCKPEGVASELADVVIRLVDMCEWYGLDLTPLLTATSELWKDADAEEPESFGDWIAPCHQDLSFALTMWQYRDRPSNPLWGVGAAKLIHRVQAMAAHYGIDLDAAIAAKMEYNRIRSYRHGGKAL